MPDNTSIAALARGVASSLNAFATSITGTPTPIPTTPTPVTPTPVTPTSPTPTPTGPVIAPATGDNKIRFITGLNQMSIDRAVAASPAEQGSISRVPMPFGPQQVLSIIPCILNDTVSRTRETGSTLTTKALAIETDLGVFVKSTLGGDNVEDTGFRELEALDTFKPVQFGVSSIPTNSTWWITTAVEAPIGGFRSLNMRMKDYRGFAAFTYSPAAVGDIGSKIGKGQLSGPGSPNYYRATSAILTGEVGPDFLAVLGEGDSWFRDNDSEGEGFFFEKRLYADCFERAMYDEVNDRVIPSMNASFYGTALGNSYDPKIDSRKALWTLADIIVCELGFNAWGDFETMKHTYELHYDAILEANPKALIIQTKFLGNGLTSTDHFATAAGQTVGGLCAPDALFDQLHGWFDSQVGGRLAATVDYTDLRDPSDFWKVRTNGRPNWLFTDSCHPTREAGVDVVANEIRRVVIRVASAHGLGGFAATTPAALGYSPDKTEATAGFTPAA